MKFRRIDAIFIAMLIPLIIAIPFNSLRLLLFFILTLLYLALRFDNHSGSLFMIALAFCVVLLILLTLVAVTIMVGSVH